MKEFWGMSSTAGRLVVYGWLKQFQSCGRIDAKTLPFRSLVFVYALLIFWIHFWIISFIKTELVVTQKPNAIEGYGDILARAKIQPYWLPYLTV
jgi:hypothetical protein